MFPVAFHLTPDFKVEMNKDLLDSAEQTKDDPQTIVYKIKQNAIWSDDTPVSADDFIYLWKNCNGSIKTNDVAGDHRLRPDGERHRLRQRQDGDGRLQEARSATGSRCSPAGPTSCPPTTWRSSRVAGTPGWTRTPRRSPRPAGSRSRNWTQGESLTLVRNDKYFGPKANLDSIVFRFLPESTTQPAALQNNEVDLIYPQPQLDQVDPGQGSCPT